MDKRFTIESLGQPYTFENSENPWIMDTKVLKDDVIQNSDGNYMTAEYMWSLDTDARIKALKHAFHYFRDNGFPFISIPDKKIKDEIEKLKKLDIKKVVRPDGLISNSINIALNLCQLICQPEYFEAKADTKNAKSLMEIFNDDDALIKVLQNRMGWNISKEDGKERPYLFPVSHEQIRRGIRNSGAGSAISNFRPSIAKFIYNKYLKQGDYIFDYSCGWGARALAAYAGGYHYYGTDPLTADKIKEWFDKYEIGETIHCKKQGSEILIPEYENMFDMCMSCPPYFTLEKYSHDDTQSYNKYAEYEDWLSEYWNKTVVNCKTYLKDNGYFVLIIKDVFRKYNLKDDMCKIIKDNGFEYVEEYAIFNTTNHLTGKAKTKNSTKNNEYIIVFKKCVK